MSTGIPQRSRCLFSGITLLEVFLEGRGSGDGLARIFIYERLRVTSVEHTSTSLLWFLTRGVVDSGGAHERSRGRGESSSAGHKGGENNHLGL